MSGRVFVRLAEHIKGIQKHTSAAVGHSRGQGVKPLGCFSWFILLQKQENERVYNATGHLLKVSRKSHGRATNNMIYFPAQAAGAHPFPSSEKDAKGR